MKSIIAFFALTFLFVQTVAAQPSSPAPTSSKDIAIKLNNATGKIDLVHKQNNVVITQEYQLSTLELTIFDAKGEYAGTLNLQDYLLPQNEIDASEKVKVANLKVQHTASGQELTLTNVDFTR
ncbi:MAG: hypothetical protein ACRBFS_14525 [Aureispira sp.]